MVYYKIGNEFFSSDVTRWFGENRYVPGVGLVSVQPLPHGAIQQSVAAERPVLVYCDESEPMTLEDWQKSKAVLGVG